MRPSSRNRRRASAKHNASIFVYDETMSRADAVSKLLHRADAIRAMGAMALYVFGSTARDDAKDRSDLDLFIDYDPSSKFNAFDLVGIKQFLEDELEMAVDVTTRDGLHPMLRNEIEQSAIRVF
jgi:predicted nucleotidyltransferase